MMDIVLNGRPIDANETGTTLGSLIDAVSDGFPSGHIVSYLFVDGQELMQNTPDTLRSIELTDIQEINIQTACLKGELQKGLNDVMGFIDDLIPSLEDAKTQIRLGEIKSASKALTTCFEGMGLALRNLEQVYGAFPVVNLKIQEDEFDLFKSLGEANLEGTISAFQKKEYHKVASSIQDNLIPTFTPWKATLMRSIDRLSAPIAA